MMNELPSQGVPTMMKTMGYSNQDPDYPLSARAVICGRDVVLVVGGGTRPHVGAAALGIHIDDATREEIDILVDNYNRLLDVIEISLVDLFNSLD
jgi:hypothetical protein